MKAHTNLGDCEFIRTWTQYFLSPLLDHYTKTSSKNAFFDCVFILPYSL